jgi:hypothetical protein
VAQTPQVAVIGMRALARDLSKLTSDRGALNKALQAAAKSAVEPVAAATRSTLPQVTGRLAGTVRIGATKAGASIRMGTSARRYAGWVEFGGTRRVPFVNTRKDGYLSQGRYLFPLAHDLAGEAAAIYSVATEKAIANFPWTNQGNETPHD